AARWNPARTRLRCRRAKPDAESWWPPATASAAMASRQGRRQAGERSVACNSRDDSRALLLGLRRGVFDQIARHRALLVEPFLRGFAPLFAGDRFDAIRPAPDVLDAQAGGERSAIPAGQRRLVVLGVDRGSDELRLDPIEILGGNRIVGDIRYHAI